MANTEETVDKEAVDNIITDAELNLKEARSKMTEWRIRHEERLRHLKTLKIVLTNKEL